MWNYRSGTKILKKVLNERLRSTHMRHQVRARKAERFDGPAAWQERWCRCHSVAGLQLGRAMNACTFVGKPTLKIGEAQIDVEGLVEEVDHASQEMYGVLSLLIPRQHCMAERLRILGVGVMVPP